MTAFLESLDFPSEGHRSSFSTALNGEQPLKCVEHYSKMPEPDLGCALL